MGPAGIDSAFAKSGETMKESHGNRQKYFTFFSNSYVFTGFDQISTFHLL